MVKDDGLRYFGNRVAIPMEGELRNKILYGNHVTPYSTHLGINKMRENMKKQFLQKGMKRDIVSYIAKCLPCQKVKAEHKHLIGRLYSLEIPTQKWQSISMDFIIRLPKTRFQHDSIFVVVDRLTKVAHFIPRNTIDDVVMVAKRFVKDVFHLHGFLKSIIFDREQIHFYVLADLT